MKGDEVGYPVLHFEVLAKDAPAMQRFYQDAFDWLMGPPTQGYAMVFPDAPGSINGGIGPAMDGSTGHVTFYLEVPDLEAMLDKIGSLGGATVLPPMQVPNGPRFALFSDPEGHIVGLVQGKKTPPAAAQ
jgi:predicted enzyme related to lactoylglutathione lyase